MKSKITVLCFCLLLFTLALASLLKPDTVFSEKENRYLAEKPTFSISSLLDGSYTADYETYLSDQFPLRDGWIRLQSRNEQLLGKREINGVYLANHQYLIEKPDRAVFESEQAFRNLEALSAFVHAQAARPEIRSVQVAAVPSASQILTDQLPPFASPYSEAGFLASVRDAVGENHYTDVAAALASHCREAIYYRTDHHWTSLGAFYGYQAWAEAAGLTPRRQDAFTVKTVTDSFYGTVQAKVNLPVAPDTMEIFEPKGSFSCRVTFNGTDTIQDGLYDWSALSIRDKYRFYLGGNQALADVQSSASDEGTLLIIKDSFANCFVPFAAGHFPRILVVDLRHFNGDLRQLIQENSVSHILILYQTSFLAQEPSVARLAQAAE